MASSVGLDWPGLLNVTASGKRLVISDLAFQDYQDFINEDEESRLRHTYCQGSLEIMPTSRPHEVCLWLLGSFVSVLADELGKPLGVGGQMTLSREDLDRGLQGDSSFWIEHANEVAGTRPVDLRKDPPPDLFIEVEISRTLIDRLGVLAALRVPEVWRYDGMTLRIGILQADGQYHWGAVSRAFPEIPIIECARFLADAEHVADQQSIVRRFRAWVRERLGHQG